MIIEGWAIPRPVLIALSVAAILECVEFFTALPALFTFDGVAVGWTLLPCAVALYFGLRSRNAGRSGTAATVELRRIAAFVAMGVVGVVFAGLYVARSGVVSVGTILVAVSVEEVVYRFAIPVAVALLLVRLGVGRRAALGVGLGLSLVLFAALPGHQAQLTDVRNWVALIAFTMLMSHAVWRGRSLFAAVAAHAVYDFANLGMQAGYVSPSMRLVAASITLAALVVLAAKPNGTIIDLRDLERQPLGSRSVEPLLVERGPVVQEAS